jgi:hypothetical protein
MTSGQPASSDQLTKALSQKVESFLQSLTPDELRVFVGSFLRQSGESETQGFILSSDIKFKPPLKLPDFCRWGGRGIPNEICWICGTQVMYCQQFG